MDEDISKNVFVCKGKVHCKIIFSDLVGFFLLKKNVIFQGQNSNRNSVKQTAGNGQTISGDDSTAGIASMVLASRTELFGLSPSGRNRFTLAGHLESDSGWSWTFQITRVTLHDCQVAPAPLIYNNCQFSLSVWPSSRSNFDLGPSPLVSVGKNLSDQSLRFWSAVFL